MYVLIVTEVLEDWEDSVNIGKSSQVPSKMLPITGFATPHVTPQNQEQEPKKETNNRKIMFNNMGTSIFERVEVSNLKCLKGSWSWYMVNQ